MAEMLLSLLPDTTWAGGNTAEWADELGSNGEYPNRSQQNKWLTLYRDMRCKHRNVCKLRTAARQHYLETHLLSAGVGPGVPAHSWDQEQWESWEAIQ